MLDQTKQLLSIPIDDDVHGPIFRGQRWPHQVVARLEDFVFDLDEPRLVPCTHKTTPRNIRLAEVLLHVMIPGKKPASREAETFD